MSHGLVYPEGPMIRDMNEQSLQPGDQVLVTLQTALVMGEVAELQSVQGYVVISFKLPLAKASVSAIPVAPGVFKLAKEKIRVIS